jgi:guanylate kinase
MEGYKPDTSVLERMKQVRFVAFVGPTASGKSTLIREVIRAELGCAMVRTTTSRAPRPGEAEGEELAFRSRAEMEARVKRRDYVQVAPILLDHLYATAPEDYSTEAVAMMPVIAAAVPAFRAIPFASFQVLYVLPSSVTVWRERIANHQFTPEQLQKRMHEARLSLHFACSERDIIFVINDSIQDATAVCIRALQQLPIDAEYQARARGLAATLRAQLAG